MIPSIEETNQFESVIKKHFKKFSIKNKYGTIKFIFRNYYDGLSAIITFVEPNKFNNPEVYLIRIDDFTPPEDIFRFEHILHYKNFEDFKKGIEDVKNHLYKKREENRIAQSGEE